MYIRTIAVSISLLATSTLNHIGDFSIHNPQSPIRPATAVLYDYPILRAIASCESGLRQFDELGRVLQGIKVTQDRGIFQINEHYHKEEALKMGYDIETLEGNINYAIYLYKTQGTRPWNASRFCWEKPPETS